MKLVNSSEFYYSDKKKYYLFPNGTLKIEQLLEEDSGSYKVEVFCSDGTLKEQKDITLSTVGESVRFSSLPAQLVETPLLLFCPFANCLTVPFLPNITSCMTTWQGYSSCPYSLFLLVGNYC